MSGNLKEVRERIKSVVSTQQITKAMKMVSASKLRRAQDAITSMRPYSLKLNEILEHILTNIEGDADSKLGEYRTVKKVLVIVVTSNRGLCGAFNSNIVKEAVSVIQKHDSIRKSGNLDICCIGKKGYDALKRRYADCNINTDYLELFKDLSFENIQQVPDYLMEAFLKETYDMIYVCFSQFKNAGVQYSQQIQFLPVPKIEADTENGIKHKADYIFEPNKPDLLEQLIPTILQTQFHRFLLDTHASEHGARMTAMDKATENAQELLKELRLSYNKARQEAITKEILEIVGGAAALEG